MGIKQRKEREKHNRRQRILDVAQSIASKEGWQSVTIRKIADEIEYSPPTIYEHFKNKDAILEELMLIGFRQLLLELKQAREIAADPEDAIFQVALSYWDFAQKNPELYQVMHGLGGVEFGSNETHPEIREVFHEVRKAVQSLSGQNEKEPSLTDGLVDLLWATLHGLISLNFNRRIAGGAERGRNLVTRFTNQYVKMIKS